MHRFRVVLSLLALISFSGISQSQTAMPPHQHASAPVIDGAVHPELIPDLTAYRLWLVVVSRPPVPTEEQARRQHLQLAKIGLRPADEKTLVAILADFKSQFQTLIKNYNEQATAELASGLQPDVAAMRLQRDLLVQSTHDRIKTTLAAAPWQRIDSHVQNEKKSMKINPMGGAQ